MSELPHIVLVHGAWAAGSCWSTVIGKLHERGYSVTAPQFPESSLAADVARLRQVLDRQSGPTVVVGHSYGAPTPDLVIAHTNLYWTYHRAPGREAGTVTTAEAFTTPVAAG